MTSNADAFPHGFFARRDESDDRGFYVPDRFVTHIDDRAIAAVGELYAELDVSGEVLDLMSSWVSHLPGPPTSLTVLGMNQAELDANPMATTRCVHDLNRDPSLPFDDETFDDVICCVSIDYLTRPVEVFRDVARVLRPGGRFIITFSNRCFPTKVIAAWLLADEATRVDIVRSYFTTSGAFGDVTYSRRTPPTPGDPLDALWASRLP